jgi:hypothetical protein
LCSSLALGIVAVQPFLQIVLAIVARVTFE